MRPEIDELQAFYASRPGQLARRLITAQLRSLWPDLAGRTVLGVGYPLPFFPAIEDAERRIAVMPASQGAMRWPPEGPSCVALGPEDELPVADGSIDRLLVAHAFETCPDLRRFLREAWRVLADGGRLLALVPNRRGFWCWSDTTPFGQGQPYSPGQIRRALQHHLFEPAAERSALFLPPGLARLWPRLAVPFERAGLRLVPGLSGVLLVEAEKRIAMGALVTTPERSGMRRYVGLPEAALARRTAARPAIKVAARAVRSPQPGPSSPGEPAPAP